MGAKVFTPRPSFYALTASKFPRRPTCQDTHRGTLALQDSLCHDSSSEGPDGEKNMYQMFVEIRPL